MDDIVLLLYLPVSLSHRCPKKEAGRGNMVFSVVEAMPVGSKPPAADDSMRNSMDGRYGVCASAPSLTRASPIFGSWKRFGYLAEAG